jgi:hypothetical protein
VIKLLNASVKELFQVELEFSDGTHGLFDGQAYLRSRSGPLLDALRDPDVFARCFVDAGALCWPSGLELSAARLRDLARVTA